MPSRVCAYCKRHASMEAIREPHPTKDKVLVAGAYECSYCRGINVAVSPAIGGRERSWADTFHARDDQLHWYPEVVSGKSYDEGVPEAIAEAADEAHRCLSIKAMRAALILGRAVIEATAKNKGIVKGTLFDKIDVMAAEGHIRELTRDAAHEVRAFGNDMAHGDFDPPVTSTDADDVLALMDEVIAEVYEGPARVARVRTRRGGGEAEP